ncbi:hypothetical protein E4U23_003763 [Claviceps purpurea]|nr:hypothetical protein E4U23_003763 [Claviceps purpurea]
MSFHFRTGFMVDGHLLSLDLSQCLDIRYTEFRQKDGYGGHLATWQADAQSGSGGGGAVIVTPIEEELGEHANCTIMGNSVDVDPSCIDRRIGRPPYVFITYPLCVFAISPANFMKDTLACPPILPAVSSARLIVTMSTPTSESVSTTAVRNAIIGATVGTSAEPILGSGSVVDQRRFLYSRGGQSMTE